MIRVDVDYESIQLGQGGSVLMVSASGTVLKLWQALLAADVRPPNLLQPYPYELVHTGQNDSA